MLKKNTYIFLIIVAISAIYCLSGIFINRYVYLNLPWLFWNIILAFIPILFAFGTFLIQHYNKKFHFLCFFTMGAWILFLPNASYMLTDLIHLDSTTLIGNDGTYLADLDGWVELLYVSSGIFLALIYGLYSTALVHHSIPIKWNKILDIIFSGIISLLCGYGVYIGRFLRFNSWDITEPLHLLRTLVADLDRFAVIFTIIIATIYFFSYIIFNYIYSFEIKKTIETQSTISE